MKKPEYTPILLAGLLLAWLNAAHASDWYAAEMRVLDESQAERNKGLAAALVLVIRQMSANPDAITQPDIAKALPNAASLMQQFRYRVKPSAAQPAGGKPTQTRYLWAKFDKAVAGESQCAGSFGG